MKFYLRTFFAALYLFQLSVPIHSEDPMADGTDIPTLTDIRAEGDDIVIELTQLMPYKTSSLTSPSRIVVEITGTLYKTGFNRKDLETPLVRRVRGYQFKETPLVSRVVLDLNAPVDYKTDVSGANIILSMKKNDLVEQAPKKEIKTEVKSAPVKRPKDLLGSLPKEVVTLDFEGADIRDVIRLMAETSNINIIYGPEVTGAITIHLKKVPFDEAFGTIMNLKGLVASQLGANILRVTTPDILQREQSKAVAFTKSIPINYLKADEMQKHLQAIMASAGRKGNITVVQETNSIVLTDTQEGIAQAERLIAQLDKKPSQVMIEARIVEINLTNGFDIGVQWEYFKTSNSGNKSNFIGSLDENARLKFDNALGTGEEQGATSSNTGQGTGVTLPGPGGAGITFGFINDSSILTASLAALISQSRAKILSAPKVVTINGQQAKIQAVQDIPFRTSTISPNGSTTFAFQIVSAGIVLTVTPTINAEDRVTLKIKPESSFPTQQIVDAGPVIRTRSAETTVVIKDGDTLVIGGLIDDTDTKSINKVPLLGEIPIIGAFFRSNSNRKSRSELLVFVTPRIIRE